MIDNSAEPNKRTVLDSFGRNCQPQTSQAKTTSTSRISETKLSPRKQGSATVTTEAYVGARSTGRKTRQGIAAVQNAVSPEKGKHNERWRMEESTFTHEAASRE
jgi:hypothetical protein